MKAGLKDYSLECVTAAANQMNLTKMQAKAIFTAKELKDNELNQAIATATLASSQDKAARITKDLGTAFQGLKSKIKDTVTSTWTFITASPVGRIVGIASAVIAVTATIVTINKKIEEHRQKLKEAGAAAGEELKSLQDDLDDLSSSAEKATKSYSKLIDGVDAQNHTNISLSGEEYEEFINANNELANLFPELIIGLDKEGNYILDLGDNAAESTSKINDLIEAQKNLVAEETEQKLPDVYNGIYEETRGTRNNLESYQKNLDYINNLDSRDFDALINSWHSIKEARTIVLSDSYMDGVDSKILMNNIAKIINDSFGTNLSAKHSEMTNEWFLDLSELSDLVNRDDYDTDEAYEQAIEDMYEQAIRELHLNSDLLKEKLTKSLETSISDARNSINKYHKKELSSIFTALSDDIDYTSLNDTERQLANTLIAGLDYSEYQDEIKSKYKGDITSFLNEEILGALYHATDEDKKKINQAYTSLLSIDPEASLSDNRQSIEQYINDLAEILEIDFDKLKIMLGYEYVDEAKVNISPDLSAYLAGHQDLEDTLVRLSQTGRLDDDAIQSFEEYDEMLKLCDDDADTLIEKINEIASRSSSSINAVNNLSTITGGLDSLAEIYNQAMNEGFVSSDSITSLYEQFGDLSVFDDFVTAMQNIGDEAYNTADAFDELADAYINTNLPLDNLTEATKNQYIAELESNGITNARTAVEERLAYMEGIREQALASLAATQQYANITTQDLANATVSEISNMITAANAAGADTSALGYLAVAKIKSNSNQLNESTTINELITAAKAAGIGATSIEAYNRTKDYIHDPTQLATYTNSFRTKLMAELTSFDIGFTPYTYSGGKSSSSLGSGSGSSDSSQAKDTVKQYNWIETAINRVKEAISRLTRVRDNTYANWSRRNTALNSEIAGITEQIRLQQQAYSSYMAKADSVGLSQDYISKIQSGAIQVEDITDEGLQDKIDRYQDWYEQALECSDAIEELNINLSDLAQQKFDSLRTEFDSLISTFTAQADMIEERISRTEEQGYFADKTYYEQLIAYENQELAGLRKEYAALQASFKEAVDTGRIEEGSEAWHKMRSEILDVEQSMEESATALSGFHNEIRDLSWDVFDYIADRIGQITQESEFLLDLLEQGDLYEDTGAFTSEGMAAAALHGVNYNTYLQQSLDYAEELKRIESELADDPGNKDLTERREALLKLQQDAIAGAEAEKDAIRSLVEDGMQLHLDALSRLIDQYKDSLSAAKDLYDYQKNISEQTENIAGLEKIMLAYQGDDSEEARKLLQDTRNQLKDARQELRETQWDRYISETEDLLDTLYDEYETILNQRLDNIDALIADMIDMVNAGSTDIREAIEAAAFRAGYDISSTMQTIFGSGGSQTTLLSTFMNRFDTASTTLQKAVNDIRNSIQTRMTAPAGGDSTGSTGGMGNTGGSSGPAVINSGTNASGSPAPQASSPQGDGTAGVGDMVTFVSGRYHEDSWGNGRSGSQCLNGQVYITKIKPGSPYPYHISRGASLGNGDLGWVKLEQLSGYQSGSRRIHGDQWAWTQEDGEELIRSSSGALLTPLSDGDTVFTNEMTRRLWELANGTIPITGLGIHTMAHMPELHENPQVVNNSNEITITLPNATNYAEFKQELQKDNRFIGFVQEVTSGQALGKPKLNRRKY